MRRPPRPSPAVPAVAVPVAGDDARRVVYARVAADWRWRPYGYAAGVLVLNAPPTSHDLPPAGGTVVWPASSLASALHEAWRANSSDPADVPHLAAVLAAAFPAEDSSALMPQPNGARERMRSHRLLKGTP